MSLVSSQTELTSKYSSAVRRTGAFHRTFDAFCAATGLLLLAPLFGAIALAIKFDDGGRVFYAQDRVGRGFRPFRVYKFRTMVAGADRAELLTALGDSRVTRTGRWLRRYKLDELPQLFNVLKGDMQLVGARPEVERYVQMFPQEYAALLLDRPGITDAATLAYRREEQMLSSVRREQQYVEEILPDKLRLSVAYQKRRTFSSDISILLRTIFKTIH